MEVQCDGEDDMNLAEAWEANNGTAKTNYHGVEITVKVVNDNCVKIDLGDEKHMHLSPEDLGDYFYLLGIDPRKGWE
jgi:hypothetical protein